MNRKKQTFCLSSLLTTIFITRRTVREKNQLHQCDAGRFGGMEFVRIGGFEQIKGGYGTILQNETMQIFVLFFLLFFLPLVAHICTLVLEYSHVSIPISFLLQPKYSFHRGSQTIGAPLPVLALRCRPQERCHCFRAAVCRFQNRTSRSVED